MTQNFFEIREGHEEELANFVKAAGAQLTKRGPGRQSAEAQEQYWSIVVETNEAFWFSVAVDNSGRRLLYVGPRPQSTAVGLYDSFIVKIEEIGATRLVQ
jgi:hypothetical protein